MQLAIFGPSIATKPLGMLPAVAILALPAQVMCPSRAAPGGTAAPPFGAWGAMRRRTSTIADPQHRHCSLGRSLNRGCVGGCM